MGYSGDGLILHSPGYRGRWWGIVIQGGWDPTGWTEDGDHKQIKVTDGDHEVIKAHTEVQTQKCRLGICAYSNVNNPKLPMRKTR